LHLQNWCHGAVRTRRSIAASRGARPHAAGFALGLDEDGGGLVPRGGIGVEQMLHEMFADYRLFGEWFEWNPELEALLS